MATRDTGIRCSQKGCNTRVAWGVLTDDGSVWEIGLDDSVTSAFALSNGMGIGNFQNAKVEHHTTGAGSIAHIITKN